MAETNGDRTQEPTQHRRQQAREEGHVSKSQDLASAIILLLGLMTLLTLGGGLADMLARYFTQQLGGRPWLSVEPALVVAEWQRTVFGLARYLLPIFGLLMTAAVAANFFQVGFLFLPEKLAFDLTRLDPLAGLGRIFSLANLARLVFSLGKMLLIAGVAWLSLYKEREKILGLTAAGVPEIALYLTQLLAWTGVKIALALVALAAADYGFQRWKFERDLRMTPQEIREEMKNLEGNPQVTARRKQVQRQLVMNRIAAAVPKADVVVTNPTQLAIALQYNPQTMAAPLVVAKGAGFVAQRIRSLALDHGIPILERKPLAQALYREVELNHPIPREQFAAVAEVLAYVYQLKGKKIPLPHNAA
ncbi:MAG: flagellar biosynthesis protein FlhB [Thermoguttaceae bacterium]|jgi:flagellar biosynthetic protein FlhB